MAEIYVDATISGAEVEKSKLTLKLAPRVFLVRGNEQYTLVGIPKDCWKKVVSLDFSSDAPEPTGYLSKIIRDLDVNVDDKLLFLLMGIGHMYRFKIETGVKPWVVVAIETIDD
ncbi:MAG: hypothetical protein ACI4W7_00735 [Candidatus Spyradenecus sp.]